MLFSPDRARIVGLDQWFLWNSVDFSASESYGFPCLRKKNSGEF